MIGGNSTTLTIPSVTQDDEDEYYCTASYGVYVNGTSHVAESERAKVVVFGMNICICIMYSSSLCLFVASVQIQTKWNWLYIHL